MLVRVMHSGICVYLSKTHKNQNRNNDWHCIISMWRNSSKIIMIVLLDLNIATEQDVLKAILKSNKNVNMTFDTITMYVSCHQYITTFHGITLLISVWHTKLSKHTAHLIYSSIKTTLPHVANEIHCNTCRKTLAMHSQMDFKAGYQQIVRRRHTLC